MKVKRLQNRIAENRFSLPTTAVIALLVWISAGLISQDLWLQFGLMAIATYFMVELNNRNVLMRTYSRMVSCSFLVLNLTCLDLFTANAATGTVQLCFVLHLIFLFQSYQDKQSMGSVFFAFAMLGIASLFFIQALFLVPLTWFLMMTRIMSMTWRGFFASIMGLIAPYWFVTGLLVYQGKAEMLLSHIQGITAFQEPRLANMPPATLLAGLIFVVLMGIIGGIHFLRNSYLDKIRTRMVYEALIILFVCLVIFVVLQPQHAAILAPLLITVVSPLIAHYITFTKTFITNVSFILILLVTGLLVITNLWLPLQTFL